MCAADGPDPGIGTAGCADGRLITLIAQARIQPSPCRGRPGPAKMPPAHARCNAIAQLLPGVARRFPVFAELWTRGGFFFRAWAAANGEISTMTIKASARSALIFAAGLLVSFAGPPPAMAAGADTDSAAVSKSEDATSGKSVRHSSRHLKKRYAHHEYTRTASKPTESKKTDEKQVADASASRGTPPGIPEWPANANAQMTSTD